jgi:NAD(P)-dependent dehydrogenase (short-subunit alcohol dehydrogenase family)
MTAIVTGGSAGIGRAIARRMLERGQDVVSIDVQPSGLAHPKLRHVHVDLTDPEATRRVAADIARDHAVTTVIHNAGIIRPALLPEVKLHDVNALVNLHVSAALLLVQAALPTMKNAGYGRVVLVSSRAALGVPTRSAYAATKAAMLGLARTWALELAPHGITVNVVAPGPIKTANFHGEVPEGSPQVDRVIQSIPVKRLGQPDDVARAVLFFADRDAGFVTGQVLYVCGGTSIGTLPL